MIKESYILICNESFQPFDVEKELNAIPALSLEDFQQKVLNSRQQQQQQQLHHGRNNSLSPTQNTSSASSSSSVSLTPTSIVSTNHVGAPIASGVSISQASVAIVNNQSTANISYHPQVNIKNMRQTCDMKHMKENTHEQLNIYENNTVATILTRFNPLIFL